MSGTGKLGPFKRSPRSSLGVEWEMQIIDQTSGELRQEVGRLEEALTVEGNAHPLVNHEIIQSTLEITSRPRLLVHEAMGDLEQVVDHIAPILDDWDARLVSAGLHPFSRPADQTITPTDHYRKLVDSAGYWARQNLACGLHVHVGVEDVNKVMPLANAVMSYVGPFIALAANSPFWQGEDTGYEAFRPTIFRQLPTSGLPFQFHTWDEYEAAVGQLMAAGMITTDHNLFWDVRPARKLGTIEVRMCDAVSSPREVAAVVALIQSLVEHFSKHLDQGETLPCDPPWLVWANSYAATRYGREATVAKPVDGAEVTHPSTVGGSDGRVTGPGAPGTNGSGAAGQEVQTQPMREALMEMIQMVEPTAAELGCSKELEYAAEMVQGPSGAQRQREAHKAGGFDAVIKHLAKQFDSGFDL